MDLGFCPATATSHAQLSFLYEHIQLRECANGVDLRCDKHAKRLLLADG